MQTPGSSARDFFVALDRFPSDRGKWACLLRTSRGGQKCQRWKKVRSASCQAGCFSTQTARSFIERTRQTSASQRSDLPISGVSLLVCEVPGTIGTQSLPRNCETTTRHLETSRLARIRTNARSLYGQRCRLQGGLHTLQACARETISQGSTEEFLWDIHK